MGAPYSMNLRQRVFTQHGGRNVDRLLLIETFRVGITDPRATPHQRPTNRNEASI